MKFSSAYEAKLLCVARVHRGGGTLEVLQAVGRHEPCFPQKRIFVSLNLLHYVIDRDPANKRFSFEISYRCSCTSQLGVAPQRVKAPACTRHQIFKGKLFVIRLSESKPTTFKVIYKGVIRTGQTALPASVLAE